MEALFLISYILCLPILLVLKALGRISIPYWVILAPVILVVLAVLYIAGILLLIELA